MFTLQQINSYSTVILVIVTSVYVLITHKILVQMRNEQKIVFIEKRLEKLYYPLQFCINSKHVFMITHYDEILEEFSNEDIAKMNGQTYRRPNDSILYSCDVLKDSTKIYDLDDTIKYRYLATNKLQDQFELIYVIRDVIPGEVHSSFQDFEKSISNLKTIVDNDIKYLINKHNELLRGTNII